MSFRRVAAGSLAALTPAAAGIPAGALDRIAKLPNFDNVFDAPLAQSGAFCK